MTIDSKAKRYSEHRGSQTGSTVGKAALDVVLEVAVMEVWVTTVLLADNRTAVLDVIVDEIDPELTVQATRVVLMVKAGVVVKVVIIDSVPVAEEPGDSVGTEPTVLSNADRRQTGIRHALLEN